MPRQPRTVYPGHPHHVTQRGVRRERIFFSDFDYAAYTHEMRLTCRHYDVEIWAWCLMPNHTHLIMVPPSEDALSRAIAEAHQRYARDINEREGWTGHLWQGRFSSFVMDERYLRAAVRYVEMNPVRAGLVERPQDWKWSSARAHLEGWDDDLVNVAPMLERIPDWPSFLRLEPEAETVAHIRKHSSTGYPLGDESFLTALEASRPLSE